MSRELFKTWGADLTPEDFSVALAGLAKFGPLTQILPDDLIKAKTAQMKKSDSPHIVELLLSNIAKGVGLIANGGQLLSAPDYMHLWRNFLKHLAPAEEIYIELDTTLKKDSRSFVPDIFWVLQELQRPSGAAGLAYLQSKNEELPVAFELPWRFGVLDDQDSKRIAEIIRNNNWQHLYKVVDPEASHLQCDMLILPFDLPTAKLRLQESKYNIETDSVIVMRGIGKSDVGLALQSAASIQDMVKTSGLNIVSLSANQDAAWFNDLNFLLSHDTPLVRALQMVQPTVSLPSTESDATVNIPIIFASRNLVYAGRARAFARRLEKAVRRIGPQFGEEADLLKKHINESKWQSENGEAKAIINIRQQIVQTRGELEIPRFNRIALLASPLLAAPPPKGGGVCETAHQHCIHRLHQPPHIAWNFLMAYLQGVPLHLLPCQTIFLHSWMNCSHLSQINAAF